MFNYDIIPVIYFMHIEQASTMAHMQLEVEKEMKKKTANKNMVSACNVWQEKHVHVHCMCRENGVINSDTIMLNVWPLGTIRMKHIGYVKYL